jgi:hypothetical protein
MWKSKNSIRLKSQIGLKLWKTWMVMVMVWTAIELGKILGYERFSHGESLDYYPLK